jgi:hypothetical protein
MRAVRRVVPTSLRPRPAIGLLTAALFLALVAEQAPHLVHHFFEPEHVQAECVFACGADRAQGLVVDIVTLPPVELSPARAALAIRPAPATVALAPTEARAPPRLVSFF